MASDTPTLDRIAAIRQDANAIGAFLEWLQEQGYVLAKYHTHTVYGKIAARYPVPEHPSIDTLLHQFFDIDPVEEEREKRLLLDRLRGDQA